MAVSMLPKDQFRTPMSVFVIEDLRGDRRFTIDGAASGYDALCPRWWGPDGEVPDALDANWSGERVFVNPPYSMIPQFLAKAYDAEAMRATFLLPAWPDRAWWHDFLWDRTHETWQVGIRGNFLRGRVKFLMPDGTLPVDKHGRPSGGMFPSCLVEITR